MVLFIMVLLLINAFFLFFFSLHEALLDRFNRASELGETAAREIEEYKSITTVWI